ncbi:MAG TPA: Trk system potassium transporter TrkA [Eubacteriaceae bacterium]|nr:Trk system potassium transporter TrkA [Eubacteriaceae bacterium]
MKVLIIGAGKLGSKIASAMHLENIDVTLMDNNPKIIERINEHLDVLTIVANGLDVNALKDINIETFDYLLAATTSDATNAVICTFAKKLGCKKTISRIRNPEYMDQLDFIKAELGIDKILNPDLAMAKTISKYLLKNLYFFSGEFASGKVKMIDFKIGHNHDFVGKRIMELNGFKKLLITAISREGSLLIPDGSTELKDNDIIHVIGRESDIFALAKKFKLQGNEKKIKNAMILGGGNVGYYLAKELAKSKVAVTLIEQNRQKTQKLAEQLDHVLIIDGDGTDITLLEEENIGQMEAFISVTGYDEQNLLMALMAKQYGVEKTIAKVSRQNYTKIIDKLDLDVALNPVNITASNILKYIRGGKVASISLLLGGEGEVTEIIVPPGMPYIGKPLAEIKFPKKIIIGAIIHDNKVIIPDGSSIIQENDRIVVFSLAEDFKQLKALFSKGKGGFLDELRNRGKNTGIYTDH